MISGTQPPSGTRRPPLRADAAAHRRDVLTAAQRVFSTRGLKASMRDIATEAGVGLGTIYRAFPSKARLVEAIFDDGLERIAAMIRHHADTGSATEALAAIFRDFLDMLMQDRGFSGGLLHTAAAQAERISAIIAPQLDSVVARAKAEGGVREDLDATDLPVLVSGILLATDTTSPLGRDLARRHLELLLKGMIATPDTHRIPPALPPSEFGAWLESTSKGTAAGGVTGNPG